MKWHHACKIKKKKKKERKKKAGIKNAKAFSFPPPPAEIKWAHEGDFKIMAFLKQAKHSSITAGIRHESAVGHLLWPHTEAAVYNVGGRATVTVSYSHYFCNNMLVL